MLRVLTLAAVLFATSVAGPVAHAQDPDSAATETVRSLLQLIERARDAAESQEEEDPSEEAEARDEPAFADPISWKAFDLSGALRCGIDEENAAWCWSPQAGLMGAGGDPVTMRSRTPVRVAGGHTFASITVQSHFACALNENGEAWCWGRNGFGNLGNGKRSSRFPERVPVAVDTEQRFHTLHASEFGVCGLDADDRLHCWGGGNDKLLSLGPEPPSRVPVPYMHAYQWKQISMTSSSICGVTHEGTGYCWGRAGNYSLGNGEFGAKERPTPVAGGHTWREIQKGASHTCGLTPEGRAFCWGSGTLGQLSHDGAAKGDPAECDRNPFACASKPMPVDTDVRFTELAVSGYTNCGLDAEGRAWCWGDGNGGTLGDGIVDRDHFRPSVEPVDTDVRFRSLRMQGRQVCGIATSDGQAWCWGHLFEETGTPQPAPAPTVEDATAP